MSRLHPLLLVILFATGLSGCDRTEHSHQAHAEEGVSPSPTNRIDIGPAVRKNLGITFATVESRAVGRTLRIPGRFELEPTARREYRVPAPGRVELLVRQYQAVDAGTPMYRLDSPRWRELQRELTDAEAAIALAQAGAASIGPYRIAHEEHHTELQKAVELWEARVATLEQLQSAGGARGDEVSAARASLASARADLSETLEKEAELQAREREVLAQLSAARSRETILLATAASLTGVTPSELTAQTDGVPRWQTISEIEVRATSPGVVDVVQVTTGTTVEQGAPVLTTVQPDQVRFLAHGLQSDLGRLEPGLPAMVVPPLGGSLESAPSVRGALTVAPTADPDRRTIELVMIPDPHGPRAEWAKAGVSAFLEVVVAGSTTPDLAIPVACVARDGTQAFIFRRDPRNPDQAVRLEADLGIDDGRWVVIKSGVAKGDEIVLDGVYQLMLATSGSAPKGGHFHSDGTFHEGGEH